MGGASCLMKFIYWNSLSIAFELGRKRQPHPARYSRDSFRIQLFRLFSNERIPNLRLMEPTRPREQPILAAISVMVRSVVTNSFLIF